ncbi:MAG: alpha/beta fold hydrolase, partial [Roseobacter sp.]|nr:alpha/beta fold hydrolase [Roseobacter sp.]
MIWTTRRRSEGAGDLWFFDQGTGPPLVLIHGVGLRAEAWLALLPALTERYRVICVDMPGHGASPLMRTAALDDFLSRLSDFVAGFAGPVRIGGHSMGALLAVELAACRPEQIVAVAALNTVFRRTPDAARAVRARAQALAHSPAADPAPTLTRWFGAAPSGDLQDCAAACRGWLTQADADGYAAAYRVFAHQDGPSDASLTRL